MQEGDFVPVFRDYRNEKRLEGYAKLLNKIKEGDSFYEDDERMLTQIDHFDRGPKRKKSLPKKMQNFEDMTDFLNLLEKRKFLTKRQRLNNEKHYKIKSYLQGHKSVVTTQIIWHAELKALNNKLKKAVSKDVESIGKINDIINQHRISATLAVKTFFNNFYNKDIIRFAQQEYLKNWSPTIYGSEKWNVEFFPQSDVRTKKLLHHSSFVTSRNIRKILCINPSESPQTCDIVHHTSYNSQSNATRSSDRKNVEETLEDEIEDVLQALNDEFGEEEDMDEPSPEELSLLDKKIVSMNNQSNEDEDEDEESDEFPF